MENLEKKDRTLIGEKLKKVRKNLKLTQQDVSSDLGLPQPNISQYEKGALTPSFNFLIAFAQKYEISVDYLLGLSDYPKAMDLRDFIKNGQAVKKETEEEEKTVYEVELTDTDKEQIDATTI